MNTTLRVTKTASIASRLLLSFQTPSSSGGMTETRSTAELMVQSGKLIEEDQRLLEYLLESNEIQRLKLWISLNYFPVSKDIKKVLADIIHHLNSFQGEFVRVDGLPEAVGHPYRDIQLAITRGETMSLLETETVADSSIGPRAGVSLVDPVNHLRSILKREVNGNATSVKPESATVS